jgi:hypothetical protein
MSPSLMRPCHRSVRVASENNGTIENDMARDERNEPAQGCAETGRYNSKYAPASGPGVVSPTLAAPINYSEQFSHFFGELRAVASHRHPGIILGRRCERRVRTGEGRRKQWPGSTRLHNDIIATSTGPQAVRRMFPIA